MIICWLPLFVLMRLSLPQDAPLSMASGSNVILDKDMRWLGTAFWPDSVKDALRTRVETEVMFRQHYRMVMEGLYKEEQEKLIRAFDEKGHKVAPAQRMEYSRKKPPDP